MYNFDLERFKTVYNIDKHNHPDSDEVTFCGKKMALGALRSVYEKFEEKKYSMISFYDDMFQYTSLGLLEIIFELRHINSPIPVKAFFNRRVVYGKEFVYNTMKRFNIAKETVDIIEREYYPQILLRSPVSPNAASFFKIRSICDKHLLVFKYPFKDIQKLMRQTQEKFGANEFISLETEFCENKTEEEYLKNLPLFRYNYFDIVICQDAASVIEFIAAHDIFDTQILTPFNHCGLSQEAQMAYLVYTQGVGPNNSQLHYIKELIDAA
jgi:hypothetical protein